METKLAVANTQWRPLVSASNNSQKRKSALVANIIVTFYLGNCNINPPSFSFIP